MTLLDDIAGAGSEFDSALRTSNDAHSLDELRVRYFGRKGGLIPALFSRLKEVPKEQKKDVGDALNTLRDRIESELKAKIERATADEAAHKEARSTIDVTLPARLPRLGHLHPITIARQQIENIYREMAYTIDPGPEIESDWYNFEALNFTPDHPARDSQDTFYLDLQDVEDRQSCLSGVPDERKGEQRDEGRKTDSIVSPPLTDGGARKTDRIVCPPLLLRTHTSNVQIRSMEKWKPPVKVLSAGRVFRRDEITMRRSPMFHQAEGLVVDRGIHIGHLRATLEHMIHRLFGDDAKMRMRPSFFPFTEPSAEVDMSCVFCKGAGCGTCSQTGWMEILGCGMVHPQVLRNVGIDPEEWSGFAFGLGIDRVAMLKFDAPNIRTWFENDLRVLQQF